MSHGKEPSFRKRLIEAREDIIAQLANLNFRSIPGGRGFGGPPDYRSVIAELEGQLNEIDALLGSHEEPGT